MSSRNASPGIQRDLETDRQEGPAPNSKVSSLVPRPVRTIRVSGGGLETSAIVTSLPSDVISEFTSKIAEDDRERVCNVSTLAKMSENNCRSKLEFSVIFSCCFKP